MTGADHPWPYDRRRMARRVCWGLAVVPMLVWGVRMVRLIRGVVAARRYWEQPKGTPGGLLYVALGDSAAQGVGASRPDRGYVSLLAERLACTTGQPVQVVNLSKSGATIDDLIREQLPLLQGLSPDMVTVDIGGNDMFRADAGAFDACAATLINALPTQTVIADVPYFMHGHWERDAQRAADTISRLAAARGLTVAPLHEALRREGWAAMTSEFAADWFHPNDHGYRIWANTFWAVIRTAEPFAPLFTKQPASHQGPSALTSPTATP